MVDPSGERFGKIAEVVASPSEPFPICSAFQVRTDDGAMFIPTSSIDFSNDGKMFALRSPFTHIPPYQIRENDFSLVRDVLDKQIVDVHDYRVVRVNDIRLEHLADGRLVLVGVDPGVRGLLRRLGIESLISGIGRLMGKENQQANFIAWNDVESLPTHNAGEPLKLKISHDKIATLHPADIADILNQLDPAHRVEVIESLDLVTAAEALAEADDDVQVTTLQSLSEERAADILEEMRADEAADVLNDMDHAHRQNLLGHMEADDREEVEELLEYKEDLAGGLMTNEYVAIRQDLSAEQTIELLRELEPDAETIYYIYVTDVEERLVGVISLRDLIISKPQALVSDFMMRKVRSIPIDASVEEIAHTFERYKLLALPVIDADNRLQGIVTIDDTLEEILPDDWRRRPQPRKQVNLQTSS